MFNFARFSKKFQKMSSLGPVRYCPQATVTSVWKRDVCKRSILTCPVFYVLNLRGWIKLIYDKITLNYSVKNAFNPTSEVQNIENGVFQNAPFASAPFANESFPNGDNSCLCAKLVTPLGKQS